MKAPGEAALALPWIPPSAEALAALTRPQPASIWTRLRHDPGCVLLLLRAHGDAATSFHETLASLTLLETANRSLGDADNHWLGGRSLNAGPVHAVALRQAWLAEEIATRVPACDPQRAWVGGLLAPLGWWALSALEPVHVAEGLARLESSPSSNDWQRQCWGLDHTALARRLARLWRLPTWLVPLVGHLGLHVRIAERLGADRTLFQVVQLAVTLVQERQRGLALATGASSAELTVNLGLSAEALETLADAAGPSLPEPDAAHHGWTPAVLSEMLRMALEQRRQQETIARLEHDLDLLQAALEQQCGEERDRLQALKLAAVAELAAGAGHEINNPLAVISGQAQYLLKQMILAEEQLLEDPSPTLYLDSLKAKLHKALTTVVGQTQRIHHVLTDLMQFARPTTPRSQPIALATLVHEAVAAVQSAAADKKITLHRAETPADLVVRGDASQWRTVLTNVLRNAVEAAPIEGWVRLGCVAATPEDIEIYVEDSGPGPAPALRDHLFDPFFSGRSAGRGRGLGLSTAWRLARQNGGEVRFAGAAQGVTRFQVRLPVSAEATTLAA